MKSDSHFEAPLMGKLFQMSTELGHLRVKSEILLKTAEKVILLLRAGNSEDALGYLEDVLKNMKETDERLNIS